MKFTQCYDLSLGLVIPILTIMRLLGIVPIHHVQLVAVDTGNMEHKLTTWN